MTSSVTEADVSVSCTELPNNSQQCSQVDNRKISTHNKSFVWNIGLPESRRPLCVKIQFVGNLIVNIVKENSEGRGCLIQRKEGGQKDKGYERVYTWGITWGINIYLHKGGSRFWYVCAVVERFRVTSWKSWGDARWFEPQLSRVTLERTSVVKLRRPTPNYLMLKMRKTAKKNEIILIHNIKDLIYTLPTKRIQGSSFPLEAVRRPAWIWE